MAANVAAEPLSSLVADAPVFRPEECPFRTVVVDLTHRCNMACRNCYLPNRSIPDLDLEWLTGMLARLPKGRQIRLIGAEPTVREDLPEIIRRVRRHGHHPCLLTNGLKLASRDYVRTLKDAGLKLIHLSMNGGFDDEVYEAIDGQRCGLAKRQALENACSENLYVAVGMILVRGVNEEQPRTMLSELTRRRQVREFHLRSIGRFGRYMNNTPFTLDEMIEIVAKAFAVSSDFISAFPRRGLALDFSWSPRLKIQITEWPDLASKVRGRLTPEGTVQPFFEHILANENGY